MPQTRSKFPPLSPMATLRWSVVGPLVDELAPRRILEAGCGQGGFGARLAAQAEYVGVEPDARSCEVARARIEPLGGTVIQGLTSDVEPTPSADLVCAFEVIEHIEDDAATLTEWREYVEPGGAVVVSVPAWPDRFTEMDTMVGHYRRYTPDQLSATLTAAGWREPRTVLYGWPLGYALEAVRLRVATRRGTVNEDGALTEDGPAGGDERARAAGTAASGRLFQPKAAVGTLVRLAVPPFARLQSMRPATGTGLVAVARR